MSATVDYTALGVLIGRLQVAVSGLGVKLDLLTRSRDRDLATFATRDDLRDVVDVLVEKIADFDLRISGAVAQMAEAMMQDGTRVRLDAIEQKLDALLARPHEPGG